MAHIKNYIYLQFCIFCQNNMMANLRFCFGSKMASSNKEPCFRRIEFRSQTDKKNMLTIYIKFIKKNNLLGLKNFDSIEDQSKH